MCDDPDEFSNYGEGVILYFSFFKFCIFITFIAAIGISLFDSYISYNYYYELQRICDIHDNYYELKRIRDNLTDNIFRSRLDSLYDEMSEKCEVYSSKNLKNHSLYNSFFFKVSLINYRNYRTISTKFVYFIRDDRLESTIINLNLVNFLCLMNIFIAYLVYIFYIYNKINALNCRFYNVSDYSILLTNLNDIYEKFDKNLNYIQKKEIEYSNSNKKLETKIYEDKLGFKPEDNMPKLDLFKNFLQKKLFMKKRKNKKDPSQQYDIKRIDLCCKLDEIIYLQKEIEELDEKIQRIEFDQSMIEKNNKKGIKGDQRFYYSCCLCCETKESLEQIKKKREESEKKMNE